MQEEEIAPHVEELARVLNGRVSKEEIAQELEDYLNIYRVSLDQAKRGIVRKHGGNPDMLIRGEEKHIKDLGLNEQSVDLLVRIVSVNEKEIEFDGGAKTILYGIFGDESGTIPYTAWEAERFDFKKGEVYMVRNAYTKEWSGNPQVNLGNRAVVEPRDPDELPAPEGLPRTYTPDGEVPLGELREGMSNVEVTGRLLSVERREVNVSGETKTVFSGIIADDTGKVQFSAWEDFGLEVGEVIRIQNAYTRSWRGIPQLNFGERSKVERVETELPPEEELTSPKERDINELEEIGGAADVSVKGIVADIKRGSGLIFRCPECNRQVQSGVCRVHGKVKAYPDLRVKAVIDDGNGTLTAILNKEVTQDFLGIALEEALEEAKEAMDQEIIKNRMEDRLLAVPIVLRGNVTSDEFGLMMIATEASFLKEDVRDHARDLLAQMGAGS